MVAQFAFDTLAFSKRLAAAGMDARQAEALAEALTAHAFDELATKAGLRELRAEMREMELRLKNDLTVRMGAMIVASTAILGVLVTLS